MPVKQGKYTLSLPSAPSVAGYAAVVGKKEGEGPLGAGFDYVYDDAAAGQKSWEKAESTMHGDAVNRALTKAGVTADEVDVAFAGDLLDHASAHPLRSGTAECRSSGFTALAPQWRFRLRRLRSAWTRG